MTKSHCSILKFKVIAICMMLLLTSCQNRKPSLEYISTPTEEGGEPNLHFTSDGSLFLSWIEYHEDLVSLVFSEWKDNKWSDSKEIAKGDNWFVNWADFPSLVVYKNNPKHLAAHWLEKSSEETYDYDVKIAQSIDGGSSWSKPFVLHSDGVAAEHGFVSLVPIDGERIFATWLDGRNTKPDSNIVTDHSHNASMTLRAAEFDIDGHIYYDEEIDQKVCDCCQTSAAITNEGPVVVYRDRSHDEIRDIYISRKKDDGWTTPHSVYNDNWEIKGCPVNGPVVVANESTVAVAWFSMAKNIPEVKVAFSADNGDNFDLPIMLSGADPLGRVDMLYIGDNKVVVSWMEQTQEGAEILLAKVDMKLGVIEKRTLLTTGNSRKSGFPRMEIVDNDLFVAWTAVDSLTSVKTGFLNNFN